MTALGHILIVDDDPAVRSALRRGLEESGYRVAEAGGTKQLWQVLDCDPSIQLITLDLMLGNDNGLLLAREIRAKRNIPIVMITALTDPVDRVSGLEHGADDYIVKPFHIREVLLRIKSILRRYELEHQTDGANSSSGLDPADERYSCEAGTVDVKRREMIAHDGNSLPLTDIEFDIFTIFLRNPGRVMSRDDLIMLLKGRRWSPLDRSIDGHIARLRKKVEPDLDVPRLIKTVWRVGYVFTGDARRL